MSIATMEQQHIFNDTSIDWASFEFPEHEGAGDDCSSHCDECYSDCGAPGPGDICREDVCHESGCATIPCNFDDCNVITWNCTDSACLVDRRWELTQHDIPTGSVTVPSMPMGRQPIPSSTQYHGQDNSRNGGTPSGLIPTMGHAHNFADSMEYQAKSYAQQAADWQNHWDLVSMNLESMPYSYSLADSLALTSNGPQPTYGFNFSSGVSTASGFPHGHGAISSPITSSVTNSSTPPTPSIPATPATPATPLTPSVSPTPATPITASLESGLHVCKWIGNHGLCDQVFADANSLHEHCRQKHTNDLKKRRDENGVAGYRCFWAGCNRGGEFPQKSKLERHLQTHTGFKPYKCPVCNLALSAKQSLAQHIRTHTGETPFKCEYEGCGQAFKQQSALTMHERTHTGVKPLECKICGKHFSESTNLTKHRRTHDNRRHECQTCGHKFCRLDQLRRHERTKHATP